MINYFYLVLLQRDINQLNQLKSITVICNANQTSWRLAIKQLNAALDV